MRISFRLNPEYDYKLIEILKGYDNRNKSQLIRKILRDNLTSTMSYNASNTDNDDKIEEVIKGTKEIINHVQDIDVRQVNNTVENNKPIEIVREVKKKIKWNFPTKE